MMESEIPISEANYTDSTDLWLWLLGVETYRTGISEEHRPGYFGEAVDRSEDDAETDTVIERILAVSPRGKVPDKQGDCRQ